MTLCARCIALFPLAAAGLSRSLPSTSASFSPSLLVAAPAASCDCERGIKRRQRSGASAGRKKKCPSRRRPPYVLPPVCPVVVAVAAAADRTAAELVSQSVSQSDFERSRRHCGAVAEAAGKKERGQQNTQKEKGAQLGRSVGRCGWS